MDFFNTHQHQQKQYHHYHNPIPKYSNKKRLTQDQVTLLERSFTANKKLEPELKLQLANQLGVPPRQVAIWYQNKRARWKAQSLELDYNTLQVQLENTLANKRRLEREVMQLQDELRRAQEMLFAFSNQGVGGGGGGGVDLPPPNWSCNNSSCEDGGSSNNLHDDVNGEALKLDELYACLMGDGGGSPWC